MRSSLKALRSLETIKIFCSDEKNNTSLCSRSLMTLLFLFFLTLVLLTIIMFLGVKVRKRAKNGKRSCLLFLFKKQKKRQNIDQLSTVSSVVQSSFHKKKKKKTQIIFHHGAEFFLLEQRLVHEDIRADTSQRSRCVRYTLRALSLSFYFSLSRPRRTAGIIIIDAFRGRDYISD